MTMRLASIYARARGEEPTAALEVELEEALAAARGTWPEVVLGDEEFVQYASDRAKGGKPHWADLYLACACAKGDRVALRSFDERVAADVKRSLSRAVESAALDDALQTVARDLFGQGRIAQYDGRGPLKGWLRVAVLRAAIRSGKAAGRSDGDERLDLMRVADDDPEAQLLKLTTREAFKVAFERAIASLTPEEALVLRQHLVDELSIDDIGGLHRVHRATAARWIVRAKERLLTELKKSFAAQARVTEDECESAIRLIQSQFDVSIRRMLAERA